MALISNYLKNILKSKHYLNWLTTYHLYFLFLIIQTQHDQEFMWESLYRKPNLCREKKYINLCYRNPILVYIQLKI